MYKQNNYLDYIFNFFQLQNNKLNIFINIFNDMDYQTKLIVVIIIFLLFYILFSNILFCYIIGLAYPTFRLYSLFNNRSRNRINNIQYYIIYFILYTHIEILSYFLQIIYIIKLLIYLFLLYIIEYNKDLLMIIYTNIIHYDKIIIVLLRKCFYDIHNKIQRLQKSYKINL